MLANDNSLSEEKTSKHTFGSLGSVVHALVVTGTRQDRIIGVCLDVLLQILRTLEALAAELALVWLERYMDTDMRGDVIALDCGGSARVPLTSKAQVVGALATNMSLTYVFLEQVNSSANSVTLGNLIHTLARLIFSASAQPQLT